MNKACCPPAQEDTTASSSPESPGAEACCPPQGDGEPCCPGVADDRPGYKLWPFVRGWIETPAGRIPQVETQLTGADIVGRWQMRWGLGRTRYSIAPGLYAIGAPTAESLVLVTANYKMTFDIVRRDLHGHHLWLMVLDTQGINVWCAAGKGTFGTAEMTHRIQQTNLGRLVNHRTLIVPQLGAPGIAAHTIRKASGFRIVFGPVRSSDLPKFLADGCTASPGMRRVTFTLGDRLVLTPVELVNLRKQILWSLLVLFPLGGIGPQIFSLSAAWSRGSAAAVTGLTGVAVGAVLVPVLLPWLPGRHFAVKGLIAGLATGLAGCLLYSSALSWLNSVALLMTLAAVSSWCAMHFTGSTTFTSPSGVEKEMRRAIPAQAAALLGGGICWLVSAFQ